jgi:hypothetical protein
MDCLEMQILGGRGGWLLRLESITCGYGFFILFSLSNFEIWMICFLHRPSQYGNRTKTNRLKQNNLIESASHATGSLLIWDTGEYSILPRHKKAAETDDEFSDASETQDGQKVSETEKLVQAFQKVEHT